MNDNMSVLDNADLETSVANVDKEQIRTLVSKINLNDPALTVTYGAETMTDIARFADSLLAAVRAKDAGEIGNTLADLMIKIKGLDINGLNQKSFLSRLPVIGPLFDHGKKTLAGFNTLADQVEGISEKLQDAIQELVKDISVLEQLYNHNLNYYDTLSLYLAAGQERLEKARHEELPVLREEAAGNPDTMSGQRVRDLADAINRFERRLHDLQLSRTIALQTAPQIRLIQSNNKTLAEKIQTSILSTIPLWKSQMVLALTLQRQKKAAALQKEVSDTTNTLLKDNAAMLESNAIETAREVERSIIDVATIREVQKRLLNSIEETLKITREGRAKRLQTEKELLTMENEMKNKMLSLADVKQQDAIAMAQDNN